MRLSGLRPGAFVKRFLPRTLLGRSLLIILVPLVLLQAVALQIFYGSHLDVVSRRLTSAVAGEIGSVLDVMLRFPDRRTRDWIMLDARDRYEIPMRFEPGGMMPGGTRVDAFGAMDDLMQVALQDRLPVPFLMDWVSDEQTVYVYAQLPDGLLTAEVPRKRLYTGMIYLFAIWLVGTSLLLFAIAALFTRNQVRAIRRLAAAAEAFGMGRDRGPIRPEGGSEVRQAAAAFNRMQERIRRFLAQRTEMLAGVSHDLRTPLTRLRLALAMLPQSGTVNAAALAADVREMIDDVEEMERMVGGYLAFARGEGSEQAQPINLAAVLEDVAAGARRAGAQVALEAPSDLTLLLRANAVRRAITNLVDNARRHASRVELAAMPLSGHSVQVTVDDNGPGIPPDRRESVFRAYETHGSGGTGLGLTIARDIVRAHGGEIVLEDSPLGGLRARIRLPV
jgi:two-component system osmolarity sensor histidine kinase EnvZ